jgi:hypothetical protein
MTLAPMVFDFTRDMMIIGGIGIALAAVIATIWTLMADRGSRHRRRR